MVSALAVAGRIGLTAIGNTPSEASALYQELKQTLDGVVAKAARSSPAAPPPAARDVRAAAPRST